MEDNERVPNRIKAVYETWYEGIEDMNTPPNLDRINKWFNTDAEFDKLIIESHLADYDEIIKDEGLSWSEYPNGKVAVIIVLDQLARNIFRKQAKAFAADSVALKITKDMIETGEFKNLQFLEKVFVYVPLEHSENLEDQIQSIETLKGLLKEYENEDQERY
mmetsp:Transcript_29897/g.26445  ORF Transcript_29897/g.26445 Transcript_29897/m.26445 type:complete len:162 (+) Transcript_29897:16-501(+)